MKKTNRFSRMLAMLLALAMLVNSQGMTSMAAVIGSVTGSKRQTEAPQTEAVQTEAPETEEAQTEAPQTEAVQTEAPQTETAAQSEIELESDPDALTPAETEAATEAETETEAVTETESETEVVTEALTEAETETETEEIVEETESESETELPEIAEPQTYTYEDGKVTIEVTVPEGVELPYGVEMKAEPVPEDSKEYAEAVEAVEAANPDVVFSEHVFYDIYFVTKDGVEVEPVGGDVSVQMTFKDPLKTEVEDVSGDPVAVVSHIQDNGELEDVTDEVNLNRKDEVKAVEFSTDSFSLYGASAGAGNNYETTDTIPSYSLKYLLEGYNAVAIKDDEGNGGDIEMNQHTMGGILAQGNLKGTSGAGYADSPLVNPSYIAGLVETGNLTWKENGQEKQGTGLVGGKLNGRHTYYWKPLYVGSTNNTVTDRCDIPDGENGANGGKYLNNSTSIYNEIGVGGAGSSGGSAPIYRTDKYVDWNTLRNAVVSGMNYLVGDTETKEIPETAPNGNWYGQNGAPFQIELGSKVSLTLGDKCHIDNNGFHIELIGDGSIHNTKTIINIEDSGEVHVPIIKSVNGVTLNTTEGDATGTSIVFTFPNATKVLMSDAPMFGHVIAPYADIITGNGNYSGCLIGKSVTLNGEGHMWPYTGETLIPDQEGFHASKYVDGQAPSAEENGKFIFYLDKLANGIWDNIDNVTNDGAKIAFEDQEYGENSEGDHWYLIREDWTPIDGYEISKILYVVKVHVEKKSETINGTTTTEWFVTEKKYYKTSAESPKALIDADNSINENLLGESIPEDEVIFNNTTGEETGSLKIKKNVTINGNPTEGTLADGTYTFKVEGPNGYEESISIQIKNGESSWVQLDNLTPGEYTVTEVLDKESDIEVTAPSFGIWTGTVTAGNTTEVPTAEFTNNIVIDGSFDLKGTKTIDTTDIPAEGETFTFTLKKFNGETWQIVDKTNNNGGEIIFSGLKLENLWTQADAWYLIEEKVGDGNYIYATDQYIAHVEIDGSLRPLKTKITYYKVKNDTDANKNNVFSSGNIDLSKVDELESFENVLFNNERLGELSVTKTVSGVEPSDASYEVTVKPVEGQTGIDMSGVKVKKGDQDITTQAKITANSVKFSFKTGETVTLSKLPKGKYVVEETSSGKFIKEYTVGGSTDKQNAPVTVEITKDVTSASVGVTNTYPTDAEMSLKANKALTNGTLGAGDYNFTLKLTSDSAGLVVKDVEGNDLTDDLKNAGIVRGNNASGEILFDGFTFSKEGTYTFTLSENIPESEDDGIEYDAAEYTITVVVVLDKSVTPYQYKVESVTATKKADKSDAESAVTDAIIAVEGDVYTINSDNTFVNRVKKGKLSVTKEVLGNTADDKAIYTVHVTGSLTKEQWDEVLKDNAGKSLGLLCSKENPDEVIGLQFSISKDDIVMIDKLPIGVYHVEEFIEDEVAYEASYVVDAGETKKTGGIDVEVPDEKEIPDGHTVKITNTYPNEVSVAFGGKKHVEVKGTGVDENTVYPNATFTFELYNAVKTEDGKYETNGDAIKSVDVTMPLENGEDGSFVFNEASLGEAVKGALTYKEANTYYYIVKETVTDEEKGFTYDGTTYVIKVDVTKSVDGKDLEAAVSIVSPTEKAKTLRKAEDGIFYGLDFTNTYTYGDLVVEKAVLASEDVADPNKEYTIYVTNTEGKDLSGAMVAVTGDDGEFGEAQAVTAAQLTLDNTVIVLKLKGSQKAKITQLPLGTYHVEEIIPVAETGDYSATYKGGVAVVDENGVNVELEQGEGKTTSGSVTVTNTYPNQGELRVRKKVTGTWLPDADTTEYEIEISRKDGATMTGAEVYKVAVGADNTSVETEVEGALAADGLKITVKLKAGEEIVVRNLAPGNYVVEEMTQNEAFTTQVTVTENEATTTPGAKVEFYFGYKDTVSVEVQNDYKNKGALEITKKVDGTTAPSDEAEQETWYKITVEGPAGAFTTENVGESNEKYEPGVPSNDGSKVTFKLRKDGSVRFKNLPAGNYAVTEAGSGFTKKFTVDPATEGSESATVNLSGEKTEGTVTVNNHYPNKTSMTLKGTKAVVGKKLESQKYSFYINLESTVPEGNKDGATLEHEEKIYNSDTEIDFGSITFTKNGEYTFKIGENDPDDTDVNKDDIIYTVIVNVDNVNGDYQITKVEITNSKSGESKTYDKNAEDGEWPEDGELFGLPEYEKDGATASFINDVKTGTLLVSKTVIKGNVDVDPNTTYTVNVTADVDWSHVTVDGAESTDITETKEGEEDVVVGKSFKIKGDETVTLNNLPVGTYTVTEESGTGYVASYVVSKDGATVAGESNEKVVLGYQDKKTIAITNTYPKNVSMSLEGTKQVEDGLLGTYSFKLIKVDGPDGVAIDAADADGSLTVQNAGETFTFNGITFSAAGTYVFEVSEVEDEDNSGIEYDKTKYRVTITVAKTDDGTTYEITEAKIETIKTVKAEDGSEIPQVIATEVYGGADEGAENLPADNAFTLPDKTFTNREKRGTLEVEKIVAGDSYTIAAHTSDEYTVRVTNDKINWNDEKIKIESPVGAPKTTTSVYGTDAAGNNVEIGRQFTIARDEIVTFSGLPIGEYTVEEILPTGETAALYTATVDGVTEDAESTEGVVGGTVTVEDGDTVKVIVTNTYPTKASVDFGGTKTLNVVGGTTAPQATFTFELYETDDEYSLDGATSIGSASINDLTAAGSKNFSFDSIGYTDVGTHYYVIKETVTVTDGDGGFTNDTRLHKITVVVTKDEVTNELVATKTDVDNTNFNFTNTYTYGSLSVQKVVSGRAPEGEEYRVTVSSTKNFAKAKVQINSGEPTSFEENDVKEKDGMYSYTFTLGANDVVEFTELPVGSYTVTEETSDGVNYGATYNVTGGEESGTDSTGATVKLTPTAKDGSVKITNTYTNEGELSIVKKTDGTWAPTSETYTITVTGGPKGADLSSDEIEVTFDGILATSEQVQKNKDRIVLHMPKDVTVKISGLMPGDYIVTEELPEDANFAATYSVKVNGEVAEDAEGDMKDRTDAPKVEIENNKSTSVEVKNTYPEIGELKIKKVVTGETKDLYTTDVYEIEVAGTDEEDVSGADVDGEIAGSFSVSDDGKTIIFKMNADNTVTITGLKKGNYTVTETSEGNYVAAYTYTVDGSNVDLDAGIPLGDATSQSVTVTNTYPDTITLSFDGDKKLVGRDLTEDDFTFILEEESTDDPKAIINGTAGGSLRIENEITEEADGTKVGTFKFEDITFNQAGTYHFTIREEQKNEEEDPNVIYDTTVYTATVKVEKSGSQYTIESATVMAEDGTGEEVTVSGATLKKTATGAWTVTLPKHSDEVEATFVNKNRKGSLQIKKTNIDGSEDDSFTFEVTLGGSLYNGMVTREDGSTVTIENGRLTLKGGQTATIGDIYYGTAYTVEEIKTEDDPYTTTIKDSDGVVNGTVASGTISATTPTISVEYVNTYETNDVDFQPEVTKTVNGRPAPKADGETYTFELTVEKRDAEGNIVADGGWTETKTLTLEDAGEDGAIRALAKFAKHTFKKADRGYTYIYTIQEVIPEEAKENGNVLDGVTYDDTVYTYEVTIIDDHKGVLTADVVTKKDGEVQGVTQTVTEEATGTATAAFVNTYAATGTLSLDAVKAMENPETTMGTFSFVVLDETGAEVGRVQNDEQGNIKFEDIVEYGIEDVDKTFTYTVKEIAEGDDYYFDTTIYTVTVTPKDNGDGTLDVQKAVTVENETYTGDIKFVNDVKVKFNVNKTELGDESAEVEGAEITVYAVDENGEIVGEALDSWTSKKGETHDFGGKLKAGGSYLLREEVAPNGYNYVSDIEFNVTANGEIQSGMPTTTDADGNTVYLVEDSKLHFHVNKTEVGDNSKEVAGAEITVYELTTDENGNTVETKVDSWISKEDETHDFGDKLKAGGKYVMRETVAPDGYAYTNDIEFSIDKDGKVTTDAQTVTDENGNTVYLVEDAPIVGSVTLTKTDQETGSLLAGAAFQLYYKTDEAESGYALYNNAAYLTEMDGTLTIGGLKANDYYFVETQAPEGYEIELDENGEPKKYEFAIGLGEDKTNAEVTVDLAVTNAPEAVDTNLVVTKQLVYNNELWNAVDATFYVALFEDEALTSRVSEIQPIEFKNMNTSSTTFEDLEVGKTYYVAETTKDGFALNSFGGALATGEMFSVDFYDGNVVEVAKGDGTKTIYFRNQFTEVPREFYREGELTVTKQLLNAGGALQPSNETFYAGIFADAELTTLSKDVSKNIVPLAMSGLSMVSDIVKVTVPEGGRTTVYVAEVDAAGRPVAGAASFQYDVTVDGATVTMDEENLKGSVVITNQEREQESESESETEKTEVRKESSEETEEFVVPSSTKSVKTGDETPIMLYVGLLAAAALLLILALLLKRRKRS